MLAKNEALVIHMLLNHQKDSLEYEQKGLNSYANVFHEETKWFAPKKSNRLPQRKHFFLVRKLDTVIISQKQPIRPLLGDDLGL